MHHAIVWVGQLAGVRLPLDPHDTRHLGSHDALALTTAPPPTKEDALVLSTPLVRFSTGPNHLYILFIVGRYLLMTIGTGLARRERDGRRGVTCDANPAGRWVFLLKGYQPSLLYDRPRNVLYSFKNVIPRCNSTSLTKSCTPSVYAGERIAAAKASPHWDRSSVQLVLHS